MQLYTNLPITSPHAAAPFTHRLPLNGHTVLVSAKGLRVLRQSSVMLSLVFSMALLTGFTGCGPASSDNAANPGPLTSMGEVPRTSPSQKDRQISKQPETPSTDSRNGQAYEPNRLPVSLTAEIPDSVAKDINSPMPLYV